MLTTNNGTNCDEGAGGICGAGNNSTSGHFAENVIPTKNINYNHHHHQNHQQHRPSFVERIKDNVRNSNYNLSNFANYANLNIITNINNNFNNNNNNQQQQQQQQNNSNKESSTVPKWSSSSNSSLSSTGEQQTQQQQQQHQYPRSIFYTDPDNMILKSNENLADEIVITPSDATNELRTKLQHTEENLEIQMRKCENLILFYTNQIQGLTNQLETERTWRKTHLTKVVKALLSFEAKLKNDQQIIRQQLYEKDGQLNRLYHEIVILRERYGDNSPLELINDQCEVAQFCPACRKQYHLLESKNCSDQIYSNLKTTSNSPAKLKGITTATATSTSESLEYLSSSDDGITSFVEARRSKKYMSKRTSGTFRDYLRSRSNETENVTPIICTKASITLGEKNTQNDLPQQDQSLKYHQKQQQQQQQQQHQLPHDNKECGTTIFKKKDIVINKNNCRNKKKIINDKENDKIDSCSSNNSDSVDNNKENEQLLTTATDGEIAEIKVGNEENDDVVSDSNRDDEDDDDGDNVVVLRNPLNSSLLKNYKSENNSCNGIEKKKIVTQFESTDDWYASASDMDDSDTAISKPYGYNAVNPVLECVNQILLQQSMDGIIEQSSSPETMDSITTTIVTGIDKKEPQLTSQNSILCTTGRNQKRVHFSTQNSMVQVPRSSEINHHHHHEHQNHHHHNHNNHQHRNHQQLDSYDLTNDQLENVIKEKSKHRQHQSLQQQQQLPPPPPSPSPPPPPPPQQLITTAHHNKSFSYESVYSNEYEPIGSENTCTTNHYVDMESKLSQEDRQRQREKSKTPPALPPKPANLMKIRQALKIAGKSVLPSKPIIIQQNSIEQQQQQQQNSMLDNESEPDYCSIPELIDTIPRNVQIIVEVHNNPNEFSKKIDCNDIKNFIENEAINNDDNLMNIDDDGTKTDITDESFADVPKLPNVAAILSPKKDYLLGQFIVAQDNYIIKSSSSTETIPVQLTIEQPSMLSTAAPAATMPSAKPVVSTKSIINGNSNIINTSKQTSNILVEIKKKNLAMNSSTSIVRGSKMSTISEIKQSKLSDKLPYHTDNANNNSDIANGNDDNDDDHDDECGNNGDEDKLHIQAEFDWYNLDAEYGNIHRPEIKRQKSDLMLNKNDDEDEGCCNDGSGGDSFGDGNDSRCDDSSTSSISPTMIFNDEKQNELTDLGIEYKLDEEFSLKMDNENDCEIINENTRSCNDHGGDIEVLINYNKLSHVTTAAAAVATTVGTWKQNAESTTTLKFEQTTGIETPQRKTYETFLQETGLTAKPLPRKRRIFYSAPFV